MLFRFGLCSYERFAFDVHRFVVDFHLAVVLLCVFEGVVGIYNCGH